MVGRLKINKFHVENESDGSFRKGKIHSKIGKKVP